MPKSRPESTPETDAASVFACNQDFLLLLSSRIVSLAAGVAFVAVTARPFPASGIAFLAWVVILSSAA